MNRTLIIDKKQKNFVYDILTELGFSFKDRDYAFFEARKDGCIIVFYKSGKLLIQGKNIGETYDLLVKEFFANNEKISMGTDESGKGDYFGPLVVVGVVIKSGDEKELLDMGVKDSKMIDNKRVIEIAKQIKEKFAYKIKLLPPVEYNTIYKIIGNLNKLLANVHSEIIEELLKKYGVEEIIVDKFSKNSGISEQFKNRAEVIELTKGERFLSCASASIVARAEFLDYMKSMNEKYDFSFPRGAGAPVKRALCKFVERFSQEELQNVAKFHFKLSKEIIVKNGLCKNI